MLNPNYRKPPTEILCRWMRMTEQHLGVKVVKIILFET